MKPALEHLLDGRRLWRGARQPAPAQGHADAYLATGHAGLDRALPHGGWPRGALTEILSTREGVGELSLLMPALARLSQDQHWLAWVAPPHIPYAPALAGQGLDLSRILLIHPRQSDQQLWAVEQALRSGACAAVLAWLRRADDRCLRRLQLAAETGFSWGVLFRPDTALHEPSPAALRLRLSRDTHGDWTAEVTKCRGGHGGGRIPLTAAGLH